MPNSQVQVTSSKLTDAQVQAIVSTLTDRKVPRIQVARRRQISCQTDRWKSATISSQMTSSKPVDGHIVDTQQARRQPEGK